MAQLVTASVIGFALVNHCCFGVSAGWKESTKPEEKSMHSVLVYHTIDEVEGQSTCPDMISPARFEQQLDWLSRRRQVMPLIETLSNKNSLVALTFDDGYRDNLTTALPLLEKYSMPATVF